jgi:hypothetical protein
MMKKNGFWLIYSLFVISVVATNWHPNLFSINQPMAFGKYLIWAVFIAFSSYTIHCSLTENFFKSLKKIVLFKWGKQIGTDLLIGQFLLLFVIYWQTDSAVMVLLWLFPCIAFGNLATLLYFAINYDALVAVFLRY